MGDPKKQKLDRKLVSGEQDHEIRFFAEKYDLARIDAASPCSFALETVAVEHDDAHLSFTASVERCQAGNQEIAIRLVVVAKDYVHPIDEVTIEGVFFVWDDQQIAERPANQITSVFGKLQKSLLYRLEQLCFRRSRTSAMDGSSGSIMRAAPEPRGYHPGPGSG